MASLLLPIFLAFLAPAPARAEFYLNLSGGGSLYDETYFRRYGTDYSSMYPMQGSVNTLEAGLGAGYYFGIYGMELGLGLGPSWSYDAQISYAGWRNEKASSYYLDFKPLLMRFPIADSGFDLGFGLGLRDYVVSGSRTYSGSSYYRSGSYSLSGQIIQGSAFVRPAYGWGSWSLVADLGMGVTLDSYVKDSANYYSDSPAFLTGFFGRLCLQWRFGEHYAHVKDRVRSERVERRKARLRQRLRRLERSSGPAASMEGLRQAFTERRYAEAEDQSRALIAEGPTATLWQYLGNALVLQGRSSEAVEAYDEALKLRPDNAALRKYRDRVAGQK